jgi:hypothetical protein
MTEAERRQKHNLYMRGWTARNKEKVLAEKRRYYHANKKVLRPKIEAYRLKNMAKRNAYSIRSRDHVRQTWVGVIPEMTQCQMCGKDIYFNAGVMGKAICFDHRWGGQEAIKNPSAWLSTYAWSAEKEKIWRSCDFGMLCSLCNIRIPTKDRKLFADNLLRYLQTPRKGA